MIALTDLDVYKPGEKISDRVWDDYDHWPEKAQRTIGYQIIRSADSITVNIAEGYGRFSPPDRKKFYRYSCGSFEETKAWLTEAARRELVTAARTAVYDKIIQQPGPKLNAFINSTN